MSVAAILARAEAAGVKVEVWEVGSQQNGI